MFDKRYYRNKYICNDYGKYCLFEINNFRNEAYIMFVADDGKMDIRLRDLSVRPISKDEKFIPLKEYLESNGYTDIDFLNPFNRTRKIVKEIDKLNNHKVYKKKK